MSSAGKWKISTEIPKYKFGDWNIRFIDPIATPIKSFALPSQSTKANYQLTGVSIDLSEVHIAVEAAPCFLSATTLELSQAIDYFFI